MAQGEQAFATLRRALYSPEAMIEIEAIAVVPGAENR